MEKNVKSIATKGSTAKMSERSSPYPSYNLEDCLAFIRRVDDLGGRGVSEASLLGALGLKSASTRSYWGKLGSSKQFGLLQGSASNLQLTEAAQLILHPIEGEPQRRQLLFEAFRTPKLYSQLIARFDAKKIPELNVLGNILMHDYRISKAARENAAQVFVQSAKYVGLLSDEGILGGEITPSDVEGPPIGVKGPPALAKGETQSIQIALSSGKIASITLPSDVAKSDIERLKKMLDLLAIE